MRLANLVFLVILGCAGGTSAGLVGHWTFDNVSDGVVLDIAGGDDNGVLLGGASIVDVDAPLGVGTTKAAQFSGAGDQIELVETGNLSIGTGPWSYASWFQLDGTFGERGSCLYAERGGTGQWGPAAIVINIAPAGELDLFFRDLDNQRISWVTEGLGIQNDVWYHLAVVRDGGTITAYLNGQFATENSGTLDDMNMAGVSATLPIGNYPRFGMHPNTDGTWQFSGLMDEVRVYNHALSEAEINDLLTSGGGSGDASRARDPNPLHGAIGVYNKVALTWMPGDYVPATNGHRIYFSQNFDDVNNGLPAALKGIQSATMYPMVGTLDLDWGERYYWRIDEANDTIGWYEGAVWEFTVLTRPVYLPTGDLSCDSTVDFCDLAILAEHWLGVESSIDLDNVAGINMLDFGVLAGFWGQKAPRLVISEFMAANSETILDGDGQSSDWIEIYNPTCSDINLAGWHLTDNRDLPTKWRFSDGASISAGGYLVVFASGKDVDDYVDPDGYYHTNFKLSKDGEYLALVDPSGWTEHQYAEYAYGDGEFSYKLQETDISYGLHGGQDRYFSHPTPGMDNDGFFVDSVADPDFSVHRGFHDTPFTVFITCDTEGATICYTTDGSKPTLENGFDYDITTPIPVTTTTCLRAAAFKSGWRPSSSITQTYIFLEDVIRQGANPMYLSPEGLKQYPSRWDRTADYEMDPDVIGQRGTDVFQGIYTSTIREDLKSLPSMSLVMDVEDMFGPAGIYSKPTVEGLERPVSVELFYPSGYEGGNGLDGFQINAAVRVHGRRSRLCAPKHALRLLFKQPYGPSKLEYPLFENCPVDSFDTIVLRAYSNHSWLWQSHTVAGGRKHAQYIRDQWARDTQRAMGQPSTYGTYVHLYINGLYWGLYNVHERPDEKFLSAHLGGNREDWDVINTGEIINGDSAAWNTVINMANHADLSKPESYERIQQYVDLENLIDTMLLYHYSGDLDWIGNNKNWYACRKREAGAGFLFFTWDAEACFINLYDNRILQNADNTAARVFHSLQRQNKEFGLLLADRIHRHLFNDGALTPEKVSERFLSIAEQIDDAIVGESARWGDWRRDVEPTSCGATGPFELYTKYDHWIPEQERLLNDYFPFRTDLVLQWYRDLGFYPNVDAPEFNPHGGWGPNGFTLTMSGPGTIWYTLDGSDPRVSGTSEPSASLTIVAESAPKKALVPENDSIGSTWTGGNEPFNDSLWKSGTGGVGYDTGTEYDGYYSIDVGEMLIKNTTCYIRIPFHIDIEDLSNFNLLNLKVRYDDGFVAFINGEKVWETWNAPATLQWDSNAENSHDDDLAKVFESFDISSHRHRIKDGANILAIHGLNRTAGSTDFLISAELVAGTISASDLSPTAVECIGPVVLTESTNVKARAFDGKWSALAEATYAIGPIVQNLRISEIMYHPQDSSDPKDPNEEFIELRNVGPTTLNLNLVRFTNGIDFTFPAMDLGAGQFVVVVMDLNAFEAEYGTGINVAGQYSGRLDNAGERIQLEDAIGRTVMDFKYEDGWCDITDGEGFSLTLIDPVNSTPADWSQQDGWRASVNRGGSPGNDDSRLLPNPGDVVINEILAHSDGPAGDWIELHNTTASPIDIGGWYLSDTNRMKYRIAAPMTISANGWLD